MKKKYTHVAIGGETEETVQTGASWASVHVQQSSWLTDNPRSSWSSPANASVSARQLLARLGFVRRRSEIVKVDLDLGASSPLRILCVQFRGEHWLINTVIGCVVFWRRGR